MKILVTGSSGYIGRHVVRTALNAGYEVLASDFQYKGVDERAKRVEQPIFEGCKDIYRKVGDQMC